MSSIWVIEYRKKPAGAWHLAAVPFSLHRIDAELLIERRERVRPGLQYRAVEYRRVEGDSHAG
jgi:hypothetical protein